MSSVAYIACVVGDEEEGYRATFPDLPSEAVLGATLPVLLRKARERLLETLKRLAVEGADWPAATPIERLRSDPGHAGSLFLLVDAQVDDTPVRVNISIGERLLKRLDEAAEAQNMTRSGLIAAIARQRLGEEVEAKAPGEASTQKLQDEIVALGRRVNEVLGPDSTVVRTLAELDGRALEGLRKLASAVGRRSRSGDKPPPAPEPTSPG